MHHLLFTVFLLASSAWGADKATIALVGIHQEGLDATSQQRWVDAAADAIGQEGRFFAMDQDQVARDLVGREQIVLEEAFMAHGRRLVKDGRVLYDQAQAGEAVSVLQEAVTELRQAAQATNAFEDLWEAEVSLGVALLATGDEEGGHEAFSRAATLMPARQLDGAQYPPDQQEIYSQLRATRAGLAGTLDVAAALPPDLDLTDLDTSVTVFLNGIDKGTAPLTLTDVLPGTNYVVARGPAGTFSFSEVVVPASAGASVDLIMAEPALGTTASSRFARVRLTANLYKALARHSGADMVLLASVQDDQLGLQLYSAASDAFSTPVTQVVKGSPDDETAEAMSAVLRFANDDATLPEALSSTSPAPLDLDANVLLADVLMDPIDPTTVEVVEVTRVPWGLIVGGGVVVAGGVVTAGVLLGGGEDEGRYRGTIIVGPVD